MLLGYLQVVLAQQHLRQQQPRRGVLRFPWTEPLDSLPQMNEGSFRIGQTQQAAQEIRPTGIDPVETLRLYETGSGLGLVGVGQ